MEIKEKILSFIKSKGPVLPKDIVSEFKLSLTFAGAYLSELVSNKKIAISHAKIGGSPVYFLESQRNLIEKKLYPYLNEKDKQALDLLKNKKVLRDLEQPPITRVALRNLNDFAVPLYVNLKTGKEIYWKWHLISNTDVEKIILDVFESSTSQNNNCLLYTSPSPRD